jgi:hypothetical protein
MVNAFEARQLMDIEKALNRQLDVADSLIQIAASNAHNETQFFCDNGDLQLKLILALQAHGFEVAQLSETRLNIKW